MWLIWRKPRWTFSSSSEKPRSSTIFESCCWTWSSGKWTRFSRGGCACVGLRPGKVELLFFGSHKKQCLKWGKQMTNYSRLGTLKISRNIDSSDFSKVLSKEEIHTSYAPIISENRWHIIFKSTLNLGFAKNSTTVRLWTKIWGAMMCYITLH